VELDVFGKAIGHKRRIAMLMALMGGKALPASELAFRADISNQTASSHLSILEEGGLIRCRKCGRHRYYELVNQELAQSLEAIAAQLNLDSPKVSKLVPSHIRSARYCYDHLAGELGTSVTEALLSRGILLKSDERFEIGDVNNLIFDHFDIDISAINNSRRLTAPRCIDWSERVPHVAGAFGAAMAAAIEQRGYIKRSKDDRSVSITTSGSKVFHELFGIEPTEVTLVS
jgi:DNA-binding transcriptional ArsR family regulator